MNGKLGKGELIAGIGGLVLLVSLLFFKWYSYGIDFGVNIPGANFSASIGALSHAGFLGWIANIIMLASGALGLGLAIAKMASKSVSMPVAASALTAAAGFASTVLVVLRIIFKPGEGGDLAFGIFLALIGAVVLAVGGWMSMQEEGTSFQDARDQVKDMSGGGPSSPPPAAPSGDAPSGSSPTPPSGDAPTGGSAA